MCSKSVPEESDGDTGIPPGSAIVLASLVYFLRADEKKPALEANASQLSQCEADLV